MKIAVASDDQKNVCGHVGRCGGFLIFSIEGGRIAGQVYRKNDFTAHARQDGTGQEHHHHHHEGGGLGHPWLNDALGGCSALISLGMGRRLWDDLEALGIKPVITEVAEARQAVELYLEGKLPVRDAGAACSH